MINSFDPNYVLHRGTFKLPLYRPPTETGTDIRDICYLDRIPDMILHMRIAVEHDEFAKIFFKPDLPLDDYHVPSIH